MESKKETMARSGDQDEIAISVVDCPRCKTNEHVKVNHKTHRGHGDSSWEAKVECTNCGIAVTRWPEKRNYNGEEAEVMWGYGNDPDMMETVKMLHTWNSLFQDIKLKV